MAFLRSVWVRGAACVAVAWGVAGLSAGARADELTGRVSRVDVEGKTLVVVEKGSDKSVDLTLTDSTVYATAKGEGKLDLARIQKRFEKSKRGIEVEVTHEKGVASRVKLLGGKKKADK